MLWPALLLIVATSLEAKVNDVIYGDDDRVDVHESTNPQFVELARSTAAMIPNSALIMTQLGGFDVGGGTLRDRNLCKRERFVEQKTAANCSGFLISDKYLVTAGHCITSENDCKRYSWVFDYKMDSYEQTSFNIPTSSVYTCTKIIERRLEQSSQIDYAVVELDRAVTDRAPLTFRKAGALAINDPLVVIGHPTGLPTKIADGANVRALGKNIFVANLDTFGGNSGSAVFNTTTLEVEGILVRGEEDYHKPFLRGCLKPKECRDSKCRGEDVTRITVIEALKTL